MKVGLPISKSSGGSNYCLVLELALMLGVIKCTPSSGMGSGHSAEECYKNAGYIASIIYTGESTDLQFIDDTSLQCAYSDSPLGYS